MVVSLPEMITDLLYKGCCKNRKMYSNDHHNASGILDPGSRLRPNMWKAKVKT
jgi:hypothetical protein